jgi:hypothetical protein
VREDVERPVVQPIGERASEEVARRFEQARISSFGLPPLLHGAQIVAVAELDEPPLLDRPVALRKLLAERLDEVRLRSARIRSLSSSVSSTSARKVTEAASVIAISSRTTVMIPGRIETDEKETM